MPNKNYVKGRAFEYKVKEVYQQAGYLVFRTAGSHSPADLIAFPPLSKIVEWQPLLIQCKTGKSPMSKTEIKELMTVAVNYGLRAKVVRKDTTKKCGYSVLWIVRG